MSSDYSSVAHVSTFSFNSEWDLQFGTLNIVKNDIKRSSDIWILSCALWMFITCWEQQILTLWVGGSKGVASEGGNYFCSSDLPTKSWPSQEQLHYGNVLLVLPRGQLEAAYIWVPFLPQLRAAYFVTRWGLLCWAEMTSLYELATL